MRYFTEFHIHESALGSAHAGTVVVVYKDGLPMCMNIKGADTLLSNLQYLNSYRDTGWPKDSDVGDLIETCTIESHPEYFI